MAIRVNKDRDNPYVMINKEFVSDPDISLKAKGLMVYLLSKPDGWVVYEKDIAKHSKDGIDSVRSAIRELLDSGYMVRGERQRDERGYLGAYDYDIHEKKPTLDFPTLDNPTTSNNELELINKLKDKRVHHSENDVPKEYFFLSEKVHSYVSIYLRFFQAYMNKPHYRVTNEQYYRIHTWIKELEWADLDLEEYTEKVQEHFDNLPASNNGNILAFIEASFRYFEVGGRWGA